MTSTKEEDMLRTQTESLNPNTNQTLPFFQTVISPDAYFWGISAENTSLEILWANFLTSFRYLIIVPFSKSPWTAPLSQPVSPGQQYIPFFFIPVPFYNTLIAARIFLFYR